MKPNKKTPIIEIFSSIQGEGIYAGQKHLFLRFDKCNIDCVYCDELHKPSVDWDLPQIFEMIERMETQKGPHHFLSLTGGEPLLYPKVILEITHHFQDRLRYFLETNGNLPRSLEQVIAFMDTIAMDIKLESMSKTQNTFEQNKEFIQICLDQKKDLFIKIIVADHLDLGEYEKAVQIIRDCDPQIPLVLQPLTDDKLKSSIEKMSQLQDLALQELEDVRIIPRLHKIFNVA